MNGLFQLYCLFLLLPALNSNVLFLGYYSNITDCMFFFANLVSGLQMFVLRL